MGLTMTKMESKKQETQKNKQVSSLTLYVVFSIFILLIYTIVELIISTISGISHDTLTTCFYAAFGGEILCCALIKIFKLKGENDDDNSI